MENIKYASIFRRNIANFIDTIISFFTAKFIVLQTIWMTLGIKAGQEWQQEMVDKFSTNEIRNQNHWQFLIHHRFFVIIVIMTILFLIIGVLYHSILNSSKWQATIGKRIMGIKIYNDQLGRLSFLQALSHYLLSLTPWVVGIYFAYYQLINKITNPMLIITNSWFNIILLGTIGFWLQYQIFSKRRSGFNDLICNVILIKTR
jgi:uncharacterized RDD family membrane protein YckC